MAAEFTLPAAVLSPMREAMRRRHNVTGRSRSTYGKFVPLPEFMMASEAYRSLRPLPRVLYVEVARIYNGSNNGFLALSTRDAADRCGVTKNTVTPAFRELIAKGFLELACPGGFSRKVRHAAEYRLTLERCDRTGALPTKAFMKWRSSM